MQTTFKSLVVALTLVSGMAMADEAAPAAVAPADGQPESWVPHGKDLPLVKDYRINQVDFMKRMMVEPWKKKGGTDEEIAFLTMYCDWVGEQNKLSDADFLALAKNLREKGSPYLQGLASHIVCQLEGGVVKQILQDLEKGYDAVAADPQVLEIAKALAAYRIVYYLSLCDKNTVLAQSPKWLSRGHGHLVAGWNNKEFSEKDQPFILGIVRTLPNNEGSRRMASNLSGLVGQLEGKENDYPWLALMLKADLAHNRAWDARGIGTVDTVGEAGWKVFGRQIQEQDGFARAAWKLKPEWPEGARSVLDAGMDLEFPDGESMLQWFNQSAQGRFDDMSLYSKIMWRLRPRWGGSHKKMIAFGDACLKTKRFDTDVPLYYLVALSEVSTECPYYIHRSLFNRPLEVQRLNEMYEARLAQVSNPALRNLLIAQQVCCNVWCGNYPRARVLLQGLPADYQFSNPFSLLQSSNPPWMRMGRQAVEDEITAYTTGPFNERLKAMRQMLYENPLQAMELAKTLVKDAAAAKDEPTRKVAREVAAWCLLPEISVENIRNSQQPLFAAVMSRQDPETVRQLLALGYDPDPKGFPQLKYRSPLGLACLQNKAKLVQALMEAGADPFLESAGPEPLNPFTDTILACNNQAFQAILDTGLKAKNKELFCQKYLAGAWKVRRNNGLPVLVYVFEHKLIDPNQVVRDDTGQTLLHIAATDGSTLEEIRFLLKHGADITIKDKNGKLPVDLATDPQICELLRQGLPKEAPKPADPAPAVKTENAPGA